MRARFLEGLANNGFCSPLAEDVEENRDLYSCFPALLAGFVLMFVNNSGRTRFSVANEDLYADFVAILVNVSWQIQ